MGLPSSKYSQPKHTPGKEFTLNGENYRGWYITTYQNKHYTGKVLDSNSKRLYPIVTSQPEIASNFAEDITAPSASDRVLGTWTRYFVQKLSNRKIIEVSRTKYNQFKKSPGYIRGELQWKLKGPAENKVINGYTYFGASHINKTSTEELNTTLNGIINYIKDYSQFVE